jgi:hypothetical protein
MIPWPNLPIFGRFRFGARVERELNRRVGTYGDGALRRVLTDLERDDLRSSYREILKAVAERLRRRDQKPVVATPDLGALLDRFKPPKTRSTAGRR